MVRVTVGQWKEQVWGRPSEASDSLVGPAASNNRSTSYEQRENGPGGRHSKDRRKEDGAHQADSILSEPKVWFL